MKNEEKEIKEAKAEELTDSDTEKVSGGLYQAQEFQDVNGPLDPKEELLIKNKEARQCKRPGCTIQFYPVIESQEYCPLHFNFFSATKK